MVARENDWRVSQAETIGAPKPHRLLSDAGPIVWAGSLGALEQRSGQIARSAGRNRPVFNGRDSPTGSPFASTCRSLAFAR
jgi:hypothetical protein